MITYIQYVNPRLDQPVSIVFLNSVCRMCQSFFYCSVIFRKLQFFLNLVCIEFRPSIWTQTCSRGSKSSILIFRFNRHFVDANLLFPFWSKILGYFMVVCFVTPLNTYWVLSVRLLPSVPTNLILFLFFFWDKKKKRSVFIQLCSYFSACVLPFEQIS